MSCHLFQRHNHQVVPRAIRVTPLLVIPAKAGIYPAGRTLVIPALWNPGEPSTHLSPLT